MTPDRAARLGNDLCRLAASIARIGDELKALGGFGRQGSDEDHSETEQGTTPVAEHPAPDAGSELKALTLEDVRAVLGEKSLNGFQEEVRALITRRGVVKLSDIDPSEYPVLLKEADALQ